MTSRDAKEFLAACQKLTSSAVNIEFQPALALPLSPLLAKELASGVLQLTPSTRHSLVDAAAATAELKAADPAVVASHCHAVSSWAPLKDEKRSFVCTMETFLTELPSDTAVTVRLRSAQRGAFVIEAFGAGRAGESP